MRFKILISFFTVLFVASSVTLAGDSKKNGAAGAQELLIPVGAKMIALNGASLANVSGIEALYWNPAGVSTMRGNVEVTFFNGEAIGGLSHNYFAGAFNFGELGVFSFAVKTLDFGDIPVTTINATDGTGETFSPTFITTTAGYSNALTDRIRVGFSLNLITEKIINTSATGVSIDAGIQYNNLANINGLSFAVVLKNLGPTMKFDGSGLLVNAIATTGTRGTNLYAIETAEFELPSQFQFGLSYKLFFDEYNALNLGTVFENNNYSADTYRASGEYAFNDMFFVRGSYAMMPGDLADDENIFGFSAGAGLKYNFAGLDLYFDYAYRDSKYFDGLNQIGVTIGL